MLTETGTVRMAAAILSCKFTRPGSEQGRLGAGSPEVGVGVLPSRVSFIINRTFPRTFPIAKFNCKCTGLLYRVTLRRVVSHHSPKPRLRRVR